MSNKVYFGTRDFMQWVKAPAVNTPLSNAGWSSTGTDLNGGGFAKLSPSTHKEYEFTWGASPAKDIYDILDYRTGAYGEGHLYYVDPFAMRTNVLPGSFSMPRQLCEMGLMGGTHSIPSGGRLLATNLATNPSFEATSGTVEVWRNLALSPITGEGVWAANNPANSQVYRGATLPPGNPQGLTHGTRCEQAEGTDVPSRIVSAYNPDGIGNTGPARFFGTWVWAPSDLYQIRGESAGAPLGTYKLLPQGWSWVTFPATRANTHTLVTVIARGGVAVPAGDKVYFAGGTAFEHHAPEATYAPGIVPDSDLTASWTGTANASASVLTGKPVTGYTSTRAFLIQSTQWIKDGRFSARLISKALPGETCYTIPTGITTGPTTAKVTRYQEGPVTHSQPGYFRNGKIYFTPPEISSPVAPNEAGEHEMQVTGSGGNLVLFGGQNYGESIWFDCLAVVEGEYTGPYWDGNTTNANGYEYAWTGAVDASTSTKKTSVKSPIYTGYIQPLPVSVRDGLSKTVFIPVPPNHNFWVSYVANTSILHVNGSVVQATASQAPQPLWHRFNASVDLQWVGTGIVWGAWGLILKDGETPPAGQQWVPGKGTTGLKFKDEPQVTGISAVYGDHGGLLNASATFIETELWGN